MGTRRGAQRQAESDAFEAANPFLKRVDTTFEVGEGEAPDEPVPLVEQDGQEIESFGGLTQIEPGLAFSGGIDTQVGVLFASTNAEGPWSLSLSEFGFGVASEQDGDGSEFALNDDEFIGFDARNIQGVDDTGIVSFEVSYMVLGGSGQLGIDLFNYVEEPPEFTSASTGPLNAGDSGSLQTDAMQGLLFDDVVIFVEGTLEVAITGINVVTNFEGELLPP